MRLGGNDPRGRTPLFLNLEFYTIELLFLAQAQGQQMPPHFRFLRPLQQCERNIEDLINEIQRDPWPVPTGKRALRSLGVAISLATSLMEVCYPNVAGRIMTFTAGPATQGPGMVVDENQANVIRGWHDIEKDNIQWMTKVTNSICSKSAK